MGSKGLWPLSQHRGATRPHLVVLQLSSGPHLLGFSELFKAQPIVSHTTPSGLFYLAVKSHFGPDQSGLQSKLLSRYRYHASCYVLL